MAKSTGGNVADFLVRVHNVHTENSDRAALGILNFRYRIFAPLWL
jgi:hypothetical protein